MDKQEWLRVWDSAVFVVIRFLLVLIAVCTVEFYALRDFSTSAPLPLSWCYIGVTVLLWIIVMATCRGERDSEAKVMARLLSRYKNGGIVQAEDHDAVQYWQSSGCMRTGFVTRTGGGVSVQAARFSENGLAYFCAVALKTKPGVWPSFKRFFFRLAHM